MAKLKTVYDKAEDIPEGFAELYAERGGKLELIGIEGVKTQSDVENVQRALVKERADHKAAREKLAKFGDLDPDTVHTSLDALAEAQARLEAGEGKVDEKKLESVIESRLKQKLGPVERDLKQAQRLIEDEKKRAEALGVENQNLKSTLTSGTVERAIREAAVSLKVLPHAIEDAVMYGTRTFELTEDGQVVTRDGVGVTPGIKAADWLKDLQEKRPHWWPQSQGGGASGSNRGAGFIDGKNPWSKEGWNLTQQGQVVRERGVAKASEIAAQAGSTLGATKPNASR